MGEMLELLREEIAVYQKRPVLRYSLSRNENTSLKAQPLMATIMRIARQALNASASSILLSEEKGQKLIFIFADGLAGEQIR